MLEVVLSKGRSQNLDCVFQEILGKILLCSYRVVGLSTQGPYSVIDRQVCSQNDILWSQYQTGSLEFQSIRWIHVHYLIQLLKKRTKIKFETPSDSK